MKRALMLGSNDFHNVTFRLMGAFMTALRYASGTRSLPPANVMIGTVNMRATEMFTMELAMRSAKVALGLPQPAVPTPC